MKAYIRQCFILYVLMNHMMYHVMDVYNSNIAEIKT